MTFKKWQKSIQTVHRGFASFLSGYCNSSKSTGKKTGKTHLCAVFCIFFDWVIFYFFFIWCQLRLALDLLKSSEKVLKNYFIKNYSKHYNTVLIINGFYLFSPLDGLFKIVHCFGTMGPNPLILWKWTQI